MDVRTLISLVAVLSAVIPVTAAALPGDAGQEVNIEADHWDADRRTGRAVYRGNVIVTSGGIEMRGDELVLEFDAEELRMATLTGAPARMTQRHADGRPDTRAEAGLLNYEMATATIRMRDGVRVVQGRDEYASEDIRYDIRNERVVAGGEGTGRVQVTIQPRRTTQEPEPEPER